jgi:hypothetical protein
MIKLLVPIILFLNTLNLTFVGILKNKEVTYFKYYKSLKGKFPEDTIFEARKPRAFYYFTGYKTIKK